MKQANLKYQFPPIQFYFLRLRKNCIINLRRSKKFNVLHSVSFALIIQRCNAAELVSEELNLIEIISISGTVDDF